MTLHTIGSYLASRLAQIGLKHHFVVPGDYNLLLLDQLLSNHEMQQIGCANELNGIGGAYAENLPVILISGGPNTNDPGDRHLLHHTLGFHYGKHYKE